MCDCQKSAVRYLYFCRQCQLKGDGYCSADAICGFGKPLPGLRSGPPPTAPAPPTPRACAWTGFAQRSGPIRAQDGDPRCRARSNVRETRSLLEGNRTDGVVSAATPGAVSSPAARKEQRRPTDRPGSVAIETKPGDCSPRQPCVRLTCIDADPNNCREPALRDRDLIVTFTDIGLDG